jgi:hypothetical protein
MDESWPLDEDKILSSRSIQLFKVLLFSSQGIYTMQDHLSPIFLVGGLPTLSNWYDDMVTWSQTLVLSLLTPWQLKRSL